MSEFNEIMPGVLGIFLLVSLLVALYWVAWQR